MAVIGKRPVRWLDGSELRQYLPLALRDMCAEYKPLAGELAQECLGDIASQLLAALVRDPRLRNDLSHPLASIECKYDLKLHKKRVALECLITVDMPKQKLRPLGSDDDHLAKPLVVTFSSLKYDPSISPEEIERLGEKWESEAHEKSVTFKMEITKPDRARARIAQEKAA